MGAHVSVRLGLDNHRARIRALLAKAGSPWGFTAEEFIGFGLANAFVTWVAVVVLFLVGGPGVPPASTP